FWRWCGPSDQTPGILFVASSGSAIRRLASDPGRFRIPAFPQRSVRRSGAGECALCRRRGSILPTALRLRTGATSIRIPVILSPFGVTAYAGNETARPQDEIADGASELRRGGRGRERERHAQARAHVRDPETTRRPRDRNHRNRRRRSAAGRLRLLALPRRELSGRPRLYLYQPKHTPA